MLDGLDEIPRKKADKVIRQQKELLQKYYDVNKLLVDCLNTAADVTPGMRQKIEDTLLLAIADIEKLYPD
ncbi:MAG: hypothetical protein RMX96_23645 [Nostoc sp. ChiSLP02]|nr:hypothetical protein [Nostoc sp. DedSLP05]MDZ8102373.1 hypothetical protein [Nostoc sp. DedSLP01]MDZ8187829.1 hypothetical protein [Nostoc sp. ChiSLP02]